ncbi:mechanosensitive ion channel protein MscS [Candidatus Francisella endociliophora]|uniref:Small-conductance mechanosensitive channel n=2 Tax=Candidatus Francisella endociliophora TaxID=653937 RepID=A0A097ELR3_9GAMM|nr:mechanosensitive ion channel protein MscS [Francisella sp. FSC1006]
MLLDNQIFLNLISTIVNIIIVSVVAIISFYLLRKRTKSTKQLNKLRSRIVYISIIMFILIVIKIWVGGISHLLTMLSLVAAGLVIVNKETVMNFVGWIIINWRSLFSEGDYIQIQDYHGYITEIKLFYFRMYETIEHGDKKITGQLIKLPNAIVITSPISTYAGDENITLNKVPYILSADKDILTLTEKANKIITKLISEKYDYNDDFSKSSLISKSKLKHCGITSFAPIVEIKTVADKDNLLNIQASFYCYIDHKRELEQSYIKELIKEIKALPA